MQQISETTTAACINRRVEKGDSLRRPIGGLPESSSLALFSSIGGYCSEDNRVSPNRAYDVGGRFGQSFASLSFSISPRLKSLPLFIPRHVRDA